MTTGWGTAEATGVTGTEAPKTGAPTVWTALPTTGVEAITEVGVITGVEAIIGVTGVEATIGVEPAITGVDATTEFIGACADAVNIWVELTNGI